MYDFNTATDMWLTDAELINAVLSDESDPKLQAELLVMATEYPAVRFLPSHRVVGFLREKLERDIQARAITIGVVPACCWCCCCWCCWWWW